MHEDGQVLPSQLAVQLASHPFIQCSSPTAQYCCAEAMFATGKVASNRNDNESECLMLSPHKTGFYSDILVEGNFSFNSTILLRSTPD